MLAVLLSWIFSFVIFSALGCFMQKNILRLSEPKPLSILLNGMFLYMLMVWISLYFTGFGLYFQIGAFIVSLGILNYYKNTCNPLWFILEQWKLLAPWQRWLTPVIFIVLLGVSAQSFYLPDNESYYIQTIKWANEQGFVFGLINLHQFLWQFSGWHILQAGVNLHNPLFTANALNAFLFFFFVYWVVFDRRNQYPFWLKLTGLMMPVLMFFIPVPSPDLAVWLLSLLIFDLFIKNFKQTTSENLLQISIWVFFSLLIKLTAILNLLLLFILWYRHRLKARNLSIQLALLSLLTAYLWLTKNYIITGYLWYPFDLMASMIPSEWRYPHELMQYMAELGKRENLVLDVHDFTASLKHWVWPARFPDKFFNPLLLLLIFIFPFVINYRRPKTEDSRAYLSLYLSGLIFFVIFLFVGANMRFFFGLFMFLALIVIVFLGAGLGKKFMYILSIISLLCCLLFILGRSAFSSGMFIKPQTSALPDRIESHHAENLKFFSLENEAYFWETGDAPLPAAHVEMIEFFKQNFDYLPQRNKRGFYNKSLKKNDERNK